MLVSSTRMEVAHSSPRGVQLVRRASYLPGGSESLLDNTDSSSYYSSSGKFNAASLTAYTPGIDREGSQRYEPFKPCQSTKAGPGFTTAKSIGYSGVYSQQHNAAVDIHHSLGTPTVSNGQNRSTSAPRTSGHRGSYSISNSSINSTAYTLSTSPSNTYTATNGFSRIPSGPGVHSQLAAGTSPASRYHGSPAQPTTILSSRGGSILDRQSSAMSGIGSVRTTVQSPSYTSQDAAALTRSGSGARYVGISPARPSGRSITSNTTTATTSPVYESTAALIQRLARPPAAYASEVTAVSRSSGGQHQINQAQVQLVSNPPRKTSSFTGGLPRPPSRTEIITHSSINSSSMVQQPAMAVPDLVNHYEKRMVATQDPSARQLQTTSQTPTNYSTECQSIRPSGISGANPVDRHGISIPIPPQLTLQSHPIQAGPLSGPISQPSPTSSISSYLRPTPSSYDLGSELNSPEGSPHHPSATAGRRASPKSSSSPSSPSQIQQRGVYPQPSNTEGSLQRLTCRTDNRLQPTDNQLAHANSNASEPMDSSLQRTRMTSYTTASSTGSPLARCTSSSSSELSHRDSDSSFQGDSPAKTALSRAGKQARPRRNSLLARLRGINLSSQGEGAGCVGLQNLGNTCFMNSILQAMNSVKELVAWCHLKDVELKTTAGTAGAFIELIRSMWRPAVKVVSPSAFLRVVGRIDRRWAEGAQQDAQEFLHALLEGLQTDCNTVVGKPVYKELSGKGTQEEQAAEAEDYARSWHDSIIDDIFGGVLQSTLTCQVCQRESHCFESFLDLALPIPPNGKGNTVSVQDCLRAFVEEERLDGSDSVRCEACKKNCTHTKRLQIWRPPNVLVLTLKRFSQRGSSGSLFSRFRSTAKNGAAVALEVDALELSEYCNPRGLKVQEDNLLRQPTYQLVGISHHSGSLEGGHYVAQCCSAADGQWYNFNDSSVRHDSPPGAPSSSAYVLVYQLV